MIPKVIRIIETDNALGMALEYLVINPSRNPAAKVNGKVLINILIPVFAPFLNEVYLEWVPGNNRLAPNIRPAAASITMAKISIEP
jgi:hypothetical protein